MKNQQIRAQMQFQPGAKIGMIITGHLQGIKLPLEVIFLLFLLTFVAGGLDIPLMVENKILTTSSSETFQQGKQGDIFQDSPSSSKNLKILAYVIVDKIDPTYNNNFELSSFLEKGEPPTIIKSGNANQFQLKNFLENYSSRKDRQSTKSLSSPSRMKKQNSLQDIAKTIRLQTGQYSLPKGYSINLTKYI